MMTLRLDVVLEHKIEWASESMRISKSELIRRSVLQYLAEVSKPDPWELGKDIFEKFDSGNSTLSENRKKSVKETLSRKFK